MRKRGRPNKKLEYYQCLISNKLNIHHSCYDLIKSVTTLHELEQILIFELNNRFTIISELNKELNTNQDIKNITNIFDIYSLEEVEIVLNRLEDYLYYLSSISDNFKIEESFSIKSISLEELLFNKTWSRDYYLMLFENLDFFYKMESNSKEKFSDFYSLSDILNLPIDNYKLYMSIRKDIIEHIKSDKEIFKNIYKSVFTTYYVEELVTYSVSFLNRWLDDDIFSDLKKTISLLKEYNLFVKYKTLLQEAYLNKVSTIRVETKSNKLDVSRYSLPNKIVDLKLNFSYPLNKLQDEVAKMYEYLNETNNTEYNMLFEEKFDNIENIIKYPANRLKLTKVIETKYSNIKNPKEKELKILIEYFWIQLFCFDFIFFNAKDRDIESLLVEEYSDYFSLEGDKYFAEKLSYYKNLLDIIISQRYKEFAHSKVFEGIFN